MVKKNKKIKKKLILFIEESLIDAEHPFERLMWGKVILDILAAFQLNDTGFPTPIYLLFKFVMEESSPFSSFTATNCVLKGNENQEEANKWWRDEIGAMSLPSAVSAVVWYGWHRWFSNNHSSKAISSS